MADPQPKDESTRPRLGKGAAYCRHRHGITGPDVGDAARDHHMTGRGEEDAGLGEGLAADRLSVPERAKAELLDFGGDLALHRGRLLGKRAREDPQPARIDAAQQARAHRGRSAFAVVAQVEGRIERTAGGVLDRFLERGAVVTLDVTPAPGLSLVSPVLRPHSVSSLEVD